MGVAGDRVKGLWAGSKIKGGIWVGWVKKELGLSGWGGWIEFGRGLEEERWAAEIGLSGIILKESWAQVIKQKEVGSGLEWKGIKGKWAAWILNEKPKSGASWIEMTNVLDFKDGQL